MERSTCTASALFKNCALLYDPPDFQGVFVLTFSMTSSLPRPQQRFTVLIKGDSAWVILIDPIERAVYRIFFGAKPPIHWPKNQFNDFFTALAINSERMILWKLRDDIEMDHLCTEIQFVDQLQHNTFPLNTLNYKLITAIERHFSVDAVRLLLDLGASPNRRKQVSGGHASLPPLALALLNHSLTEVVQLLLDYGALVTDIPDCHSIDQAIASGWPEPCIHELIYRQIDACDDWSQLPTSTLGWLLVAGVECNDDSQVYGALVSGADPNFQKTVNTITHKAQTHSTATDTMGRTTWAPPLALALQDDCKSTEIVSLLVDYGASLTNIPNMSIDEAIHDGWPENLIYRLIDMGRFSGPTALGWQLILAIHNNDLPGVTRALASGADPEFQKVAIVVTSTQDSSSHWTTDGTEYIFLTPLEFAQSEQPDILRLLEAAIHAQKPH